MICRGHCFNNGLIMRAVGDTMIISPPLILTREHVDELVTKAHRCLDLTLADLKAGRGPLRGRAGDVLRGWDYKTRARDGMLELPEESSAESYLCSSLIRGCCVRSPPVFGY